jgi:hypothetical protein
MKYRVHCPNDHSLELNATELESLIRSGEFECDQCGGRLHFSDGVELVCRICDDIYIVSSIEEAHYTTDDDCTSCSYREFHDYSIHVPYSWDYYRGMYEWMMSGRDSSELARPSREDIWDGLVHFCSAHEIASIMQEGRIHASRTGYFKVPAVCFSEAPPGNWGDLAGRQGGFGIVFKRSDIMNHGGGPAIYIRDEILRDQKSQGIVENLKPFVNTLREAAPGVNRHNFLHEREWRCPSDVLLNAVIPFALIRGEFSTKIPGWEYIWKALIQYEELA